MTTWSAPSSTAICRIRPSRMPRDLGCTFTDIALGRRAVRHRRTLCADAGADLRMRRSSSTGPPRTRRRTSPTIRTSSNTTHAPPSTPARPAARIVGITADRVAVLVSAPEPAVVVYDETGAETSRTAVDIPAESIVAADQLTATGAPRRHRMSGTASARYSLIGDRLLAVTSQTRRGDRPAVHAHLHLGDRRRGATDRWPAGRRNRHRQRPRRRRRRSRSRTSACSGPRTGALGLPAVIGEQVLMPVTGGLARLRRAERQPRDSCRPPSRSTAAATPGGWTPRPSG